MMDLLMRKSKKLQRRRSCRLSNHKLRRRISRQGRCRRIKRHGVWNCFKRLFEPWTRRCEM